MELLSEDIRHIVALLARAPLRIEAATRACHPTRLELRSATEPWSASDILAHLRACADMWGKYIGMILSEDRPTFRAVNPTTWIKQTNYREQAFQPSLHAFTTQRAELLAVLSR